MASRKGRRPQAARTPAGPAKARAKAPGQATAQQARATLAALRRLAAEFGRAEAARALGLSAPTLKRYLSQGLPARVRARGGQVAALGELAELQRARGVQPRAVQTRQQPRAGKKGARERSGAARLPRAGEGSRDSRKARTPTKTPPKAPLGVLPLNPAAPDAVKLQWLMGRLSILLGTPEAVGKVLGVTPQQIARWRRSGLPGRLAKDPGVLAELIARGEAKLRRLGATKPSRQRMAATLEAAQAGQAGLVDAAKQIAAEVERQNHEDERCGIKQRSGVRRAAAALEVTEATVRSWLKEGHVPESARLKAVRFITETRELRAARLADRPKIVELLKKARKMNIREHTPPTVVEDFAGTFESDVNVSKVWSKKYEGFLDCDMVDDMMGFIDTIPRNRPGKLRYPYWLATATMSGLQKEGQGEGDLAGPYETVIVDFGNEEDTKIGDYLNLNFFRSSATQKSWRAMKQVFRQEMLGVVATGYQVFVWGLVVRNWRHQTEVAREERHQRYLAKRAERNRLQKERMLQRERVKGRKARARTRNKR